MFTLDEALAATREDYRCDPEATLALWLYAGSRAATLKLIYYFLPLFNTEVQLDANSVGSSKELSLSVKSSVSSESEISSASSDSGIKSSGVNVAVSIRFSAALK